MHIDEANQKDQDHQPIRGGCNLKEKWRKIIIVALFL